MGDNINIYYFKLVSRACAFPDLRVNVGHGGKYRGLNVEFINGTFLTNFKCMLLLHSVLVIT